MSIPSRSLRPSGQPAVGRRAVVAGLLGLAGATLPSGCGGVWRQPGNGISFLDWDVVAGTPLQRAIRAYRKQSGQDVEVQPAPTEDYDTKMRTYLAGGNPPDVMRMNDDFLRGFSAQGVLRDLRPDIMRDRVDTSRFAREAFAFPRQPDGRHTAWVIGYEPRLVFYNVDLFRQQRLPMPPSDWTGEDWSWQDFLDRAKSLTVPGKRWGALVYLDTGYEQTFTVNHGSETGIFSRDGRQFTLDRETEAEAVQWAVDLTCEYGVQPPWSQLQQPNADTQLFAQGRLAMMFATFGVVPYLRETVKDFEWDVAPPPADQNQLTESSVIVFAVPENARNPKGGWDLLKFLSSEEGGRILAKGAALTPIHADAAASIQPGDEPPASITLFAEAANHLAATNQTMNTLGARELYRPALDAAYNCERPVSDVLSEVRPQVEDALEGHG